MVSEEKCASKIHVFSMNVKNPHFCPEIHSKIARKSPDFARFQKPFVKSNPPFVKSNPPFIKSNPPFIFRLLFFKNRIPTFDKVELRMMNYELQNDGTIVETQRTTSLRGTSDNENNINKINNYIIN